MCVCRIMRGESDILGNKIAIGADYFSRRIEMGKVGILVYAIFMKPRARKCGIYFLCRMESSCYTGKG
jgi:hypothetical protein